MKLCDWLLSGNPVVLRLTRKYLLDETPPYTDSGFIGRHLESYDPKRRLFGGGIYTPKWISTHYTLMELKAMEIDPKDPVFRDATLHLLERMWVNEGKVTKNRHQDMCVVAMMLALAAYASIRDERIFEMIDYILAHQFADGGWNCEWDSTRKPTRSSVHTTLSVLEAFAIYLHNGYSYRQVEIKRAIPPAEDFLLRKKLFRSERTGAVFSPQMTEFHFPERWKYDCFRALEYFSSVLHPYDERMQDAFDIMFRKLKRGYIGKGTTYSGMIRFPLGSGSGGRFNTLKALKILKFYYPDRFHTLFESEIRI